MRTLPVFTRVHVDYTILVDELYNDDDDDDDNNNNNNNNVC
jgi:hypothetical protein